MLVTLGLLLLAYLLGSVSFGLLLARFYHKVNLRQRGSGNIGATNVARTLGKTAGVLTLLGDCGKGLLAVLLMQWWESAPWLSALAALSAVIGHLFPLYHGFQGGKGVATALGVLLPTLPLPVLGGCMTWVVAVALWRYVSVGSILAAILVPILATLLAYPFPLVSVAAVIAALVLYKHRSNMQRLWQGCEPKLSR
jgi:glycerol-3-phosphate acyltransferase PlsY